MGLGWDDLGDLNDYKTKEEITLKLQDLEKTTGSKKNDSSANYEFKDVIKIGDIIIAKKGRGELLGYGVVTSDYYYDKERTRFQKCRTVDWKKKGNWKSDHSLALKTLTDITNYPSEHPDYNKYYERLLGIMDNVKSKKNYKEAYIKWLNNAIPKDSGTKSSYIRAIEFLSEKVDYNIFEEDDINKIKLLYEDLINEQKIEGGKYYHESAPSYVNKGFYSASIKTYSDFLTEYLSTDKTMQSSNYFFPLNIIFYGPPGTGKTYNTILRAAEIIESRKIDNFDEAKNIFKKNLHNKIEFITFHQNYSYEDFIQGLRPDTENDKELTFEKKDGIFKIIADRALKNLIESEAPKIVKKSFEEIFNEFIKPLIEGDVEEIEVKMKKVSFFITAINKKSIDFRKASGGTSHTLSLATLKQMYDAESVLEIQGLSSYYSPLLDVLLKLGIDSSGRKEEISRNNYVIVIDEINRANISRVFGELITLIEVDKRSHGEIPLEARLPSGDLFVVPSNLYIIGTMNTADKSIALLDIALRRRFEFEPMYPDYLIEGINDLEILKKINTEIIKLKGYDFQIGHSYFMNSKEDTYNLGKRMNKKIIPLLLEYFMNNRDEVEKIIRSAGLTLKNGSWPLEIIE